MAITTDASVRGVGSVFTAGELEEMGAVELTNDLGEEVALRMLDIISIMQISPCYGAGIYANESGLTAIYRYSAGRFGLLFVPAKQSIRHRKTILNLKTGDVVSMTTLLEFGGHIVFRLTPSAAVSVFAGEDLSHMREGYALVVQVHAQNIVLLTKAINGFVDMWEIIRE